MRNETTKEDSIYMWWTQWITLPERKQLSYFYFKKDSDLITSEEIITISEKEEEFYQKLIIHDIRGIMEESRLWWDDLSNDKKYELCYKYYNSDYHSLDARYLEKIYIMETKI